jgi:hypothetical protein
MESSQVAVGLRGRSHEVERPPLWFRISVGPPVTPRPLGRSHIGRLTWVGLLAIVTATAVNVLIGYLAVTFLDISNLFSPLNGYGTIVPFTVIGVAGATVVYALITRYSRSPMRLFLWIAGAALALSFVPDILLLVFSVPGATPISVGVLLVMHVAAFLVSVGMLTRLAPPSWNGAGTVPPDVQRRRK